MPLPQFNPGFVTPLGSGGGLPTGAGAGGGGGAVQGNPTATNNTAAQASQLLGLLGRGTSLLGGANQLSNGQLFADIPGFGQALPILGGLFNVGAGAANIAGQSGLTDEQKAGLAGLNAGAAALNFAVPALGPFVSGFGPPIENEQGGLVGAILSAFDFKQHVPHAVREGIEVKNDLGVLNSAIGPLIQSAQSPDQVYQAFNYANNPNFGHDLGPILFEQGGKAHPLSDKAAFMAMLSGDPNAIQFLWQHGLAQGTVDKLNQALDSGVRDQLSLIQRAQGGDLLAQMQIANSQYNYAQGHGSVFGTPFSKINPTLAAQMAARDQANRQQLLNETSLSGVLGAGGGGGDAGAP